MKASAKLLTKLTVTGLTLVFFCDTVFPNPLAAQQGTSGGSFAPPSDTQTAPTTEPMQSSNGSDAKSAYDALLMARQALSAGNVARAKSLVDAARRFPIDPSLGDTPAKVEAMIARHGELAKMARYGDQHQYNLGAALFLLEQAEGLIDYRDFATSESLILLAKQFPVTFQPGDRNPDRVMDRLNQIRGSGAAEPQNISAARLEASRLLSQAQLAFDQRNLEQAQMLLGRAKALNVPDSSFDDAAVRPWELELKIRQAWGSNATVATTGFQEPTEEVVKQANYYPELDSTRNEKASAEIMPPPTSLPNPANIDTGSFQGNSQVAQTSLSTNRNEVLAADDGFQLPEVRGKQLYDSGMSALANNDQARALEYLRMAWKYKAQLDPQAQQNLQDKLSLLQTTPAAFQQAEQIQGVDTELRRQMSNEIMRQRAVAERMKEERNPRGALNHLRMLRDQIVLSELDPASKQQMTALVDREISDMESYIQYNLADIENDEINELRRQELASDRQHRDDLERNIQQLVEEFNQLSYEQRYAEAEAIARQAAEIAPNHEVISSMLEQAKFRRRADDYDELQALKEQGFIDAMRNAETGLIPFDERRPLQFAENWADIRNREDISIAHGSEAERRVRNGLREQTFSGEFSQTPLAEVIDTLALSAGINMIFDTRALQMENVAIDQPVTMSFPNPISIHSALNIILGNHNLVFKVEDEVVKITNRDALQKAPDRKVYYVGDLVVPLPDFGRPLNMSSMTPWNSAGGGWNNNGLNNTFSGMQGNQVPVSMQGLGMPNPQVGLGLYGSGGPPQSGVPEYNTLGPPELGGGVTEADFQELMDLILETIDPDSWEENGGSGRMQPFPSTLSLIVTQTQENQDRIQNLLNRLRELNDAQIVVEVRFITLRDDFFERIGVDFDFRIEDNSGLVSTAIPDTVIPSGTVGRDPIAEAFVPTADLDIPFTQNSFGSVIPQFGNFDAATAANFGFAILSDIEVFFLLQAAKGDERSNVVQAPTVTMFNGQSANVFDGTAQPFVTSVTPIVGDFAAAQQPIITILPEGTQLSVRATVSSDRRFVKMTLVPFFSQITNVDEFKFVGSRTVRGRDNSTLNNILDAIGGGDIGELGDDFEITEEGTTVQLPTFANTTITTTVSVPDGGTVLLGGIKRMSEGRLERGVPFLSNVPYVNRLFKNISIGRETSSLMMMVTPRIIIQEEEEMFQVGSSGN